RPPAPCPEWPSPTSSSSRAAISSQSSMPEREIRLWGDPVLRSVCEPVTVFDDSGQALADDLVDSALPEGRAAVAAPQIGGRLRDIEEGCLSVPGLFFPTPRYEFARVRGVDAKGEAVEVEGTEVFAQMLQHEVAHLDGQVYVQTLPKERRREAMKAIRSSDWFLARMG